MFRNMIRRWFGTVRSDYNDFVQALLLGDVDAMNEYMNRVAFAIISNRESGFGRYDVVLEPIGSQDDAIILEFKVQNARRERSLEETLENALKQIEDKEYAATLTARGISKERIRMYGFAFEGKKVLIGTRQTEFCCR